MSDDFGSLELDLEGVRSHLTRGDLDRIAHAIEEVREGRMIMIVDQKGRPDQDRAFLYVAAEAATAELIERISASSSAPPCLVMTSQRWNLLAPGEEPISLSAKVVRGTGAQSVAQALTVRCAIDDKWGRDDFGRPGCLRGMRAADRGVFERAGYGEAMIDLARIAGFAPAAVIAELAPGSSTAAAQLLSVRVAEVVAYRFRRETHLHRAVEAQLPTDAGGDFRAIAYENEINSEVHLALVKGEVSRSSDPVLVRIHSKCLTGDALGSQRCDCGPQLEQALIEIDEAKRGVLVYLDQEGRGIGLVNKLRAYALQDQGHDTVSANVQLGFAADVRDYGIAAQILLDLGINRVKLMTNNPRKVAGLEAHGLEVTRSPIEVRPTKHNARYLRTKRDKLGHLLTHLDHE